MLISLAANACSAARQLRDLGPSFFELNEAHWITGRISEEAENDYPRHLESRYLDGPAVCLYFLQFRCHVIHADVQSLLGWVLSKRGPKRHITVDDQLARAM